LATITTNIQQAINCLNQGELVGIPTETVYGLAANAFNPLAIAHIYTVKKRPQFNPLIIHSNSLERFASWGIHLPKKALKLAQVFAPGPLTFVVPTSHLIPDIVTAGHSSVAIRIPNHPLTLSLLKNLNYPLAAPSANPSGYVSPTKAAHVAEQLADNVCCILDGGDCQVGLESTILDFTHKNIKLLRYGGLSVEKIEKTLDETIDKSSIINNDNPLAPGMLSKHYATHTKLLFLPFKKFTQPYNPQKTGIITLSQFVKEIPLANQILLDPNGNLEQAAANLFNAMRQMDKMNLNIIIAEPMPQTGLGLAINDRLKRASTE